MTSCFLNDKIYAIGGWRHSGNGPIYDKIEAFDINQNVWMTQTSMPMTLALLSSCIHNGKIYTYGGSRTTHPLTGTTEIYEYAPVTAIKDDLLRVPDEFNMSQNYPNPFNPSTTIEFGLPKSSDVTLKIFNILGEEMAALVSERLSAGSYSYEWSRTGGIASGVYLYRLQAGNYVETRKMVLLQ
jgi:hypothetical protein